MLSLLVAMVLIMSNVAVCVVQDQTSCPYGLLPQTPPPFSKNLQSWHSKLRMPSSGNSSSMSISGNSMSGPQQLRVYSWSDSVRVTLSLLSADGALLSQSEDQILFTLDTQKTYQLALTFVISADSNVDVDSLGCLTYTLGFSLASASDLVPCDTATVSVPRVPPVLAPFPFAVSVAGVAPGDPFFSPFTVKSLLTQFDVPQSIAYGTYYSFEASLTLDFPTGAALGLMLAPSSLFNGESPPDLNCVSSGLCTIAIYDGAGFQKTLRQLLVKGRYSLFLYHQGLYNMDGGCIAFSLDIRVNRLSESEDFLSCSFPPFPPSFNEPGLLSEIHHSTLIYEQRLLLDVGAVDGQSIALSVKDRSLLRVFLARHDRIDVDLEINGPDGAYWSSASATDDEKLIAVLPAAGDYTISVTTFGVYNHVELCESVKLIAAMSPLIDVSVDYCPSTSVEPLGLTAAINSGIPYHRDDLVHIVLPDNGVPQYTVFEESFEITSEQYFFAEVSTSFLFSSARLELRGSGLEHNIRGEMNAHGNRVGISLIPGSYTLTLKLPMFSGHDQKCIKYSLKVGNDVGSDNSCLRHPVLPLSFNIPGLLEDHLTDHFHFSGRFEAPPGQRNDFLIAFRHTTDQQALFTVSTDASLGTGLDLDLELTRDSDGLVVGSSLEAADSADVIRVILDPQTAYTLKVTIYRFDVDGPECTSFVLEAALEGERIDNSECPVEELPGEPDGFLLKDPEFWPDDSRGVFSLSASRPYIDVPLAPVYDFPYLFRVRAQFEFVAYPISIKIFNQRSFLYRLHATSSQFLSGQDTGAVVLPANGNYTMRIINPTQNPGCIEMTLHYSGNRMSDEEKDNVFCDSVALPSRVDVGSLTAHKFHHSGPLLTAYDFNPVVSSFSVSVPSLLSLSTTSSLSNLMVNEIQCGSACSIVIDSNTEWRLHFAGWPLQQQEECPVQDVVIDIKPKSSVVTSTCQSGFPGQLPKAGEVVSFQVPEAADSATYALPQFDSAFTLFFVVEDGSNANILNFSVSAATSEETYFPYIGTTGRLEMFKVLPPDRQWQVNLQTSGFNSGTVHECVGASLHWSVLGHSQVAQCDVVPLPDRISTPSFGGFSFAAPADRSVSFSVAEDNSYFGLWFSSVHELSIVLKREPVSLASTVFAVLADQQQVTWMLPAGDYVLEFSNYGPTASDAECPHFDMQFELETEAEIADTLACPWFYLFRSHLPPNSVRGPIFNLDKDYVMRDSLIKEEWDRSTEFSAAYEYTIVVDLTLAPAVLNVELSYRHVEVFEFSVRLERDTGRPLAAVQERLADGSIVNTFNDLSLEAGLYRLVITDYIHPGPQIPSDICHAFSFKLDVSADNVSLPPRISVFPGTASHIDVDSPLYLRATFSEPVDATASALKAAFTLDDVSPTTVRLDRQQSTADLTWAAGVLRVDHVYQLHVDGASLHPLSDSSKVYTVEPADMTYDTHANETTVSVTTITTTAAPTSRSPTTRAPTTTTKSQTSAEPTTSVATTPTATPTVEPTSAPPKGDKWKLIALAVGGVIVSAVILAIGIRMCVLARRQKRNQLEPAGGISLGYMNDSGGDGDLFFDDGFDSAKEMPISSLQDTDNEFNLTAFDDDNDDLF